MAQKQENPPTYTPGAYPGYPPQQYPPQGYVPPQGYAPQQGYPPQQYPPQQFGYPAPGPYPQDNKGGAPGYPPQGYAQQGYPQQGYPPQQFNGPPQQGYPGQPYPQYVAAPGVVYTTPPPGSIVTVTEQRKGSLETMKVLIPIMPFGLAMVLCIINFILPGIGTIIAAFCVLCNCVNPGDKTADRCASFWSNLMCGLLQLATAPFLIGWGWSIFWGCLFVGQSVDRGSTVVTQHVTNAAGVPIQTNQTTTATVRIT